MAKRSKASAADPIAPMLAVLATVPPADEQWLIEFKWDGIRALCHCDRSGLMIRSRNLLDITRRYPELHGICAALKKRSAVLDGEIVALDDNSQPSFKRLQNRMHVKGAGDIERLMRTTPVHYFIFDLLWLDGKSTVDLPLDQRRAMLESLGLSGTNWQISPVHRGEGPAMLAAARKAGLEGIVAKRADGRYLPGARSPSWLKIKITTRREFVVGGWTGEKGNRAGLGALLVGYFDDEGLRYVGKVGTGFSSAVRTALLEWLRAHPTGSTPFVDPIPQRGKTQHVKPALVVEIEYRRWPSGGMIQHAALAGIRTDISARSVRLV